MWIAERGAKLKYKCEAVTTATESVIIRSQGTVYLSHMKNTDTSNMKAFCDLLLINRSAIEHKRIHAKKVNDENEKFAMRIWLDSIGLRGELYKQSRSILTKPLHGITAFKTQEQPILQ